jgi:hypothetical protein
MRDLNISVFPNQAGETVFNFTVDGPVVHTQGSGTPLPSVFMDLSYPSGKTGNTPSCMPTWRCHHFQGNPFLPLRVTLVDDRQGQGTTEYSAQVVFSGPPLGIDSDHTSATAELPAVQLPLAQDFLTGAVEMHYTLAGAPAYDWTTGQAPVLRNGDVLTWYLNVASQTLSSGLVVYQSVSSSAGAVNQSALQHEQFLTFFAGALFGVAGGALVGALQEFLDARESARRPVEPKTVEA